MKAISMWQFWASAVELGLKHNETRHWSTNYRGELAIHAARKDTSSIRDLFWKQMLQSDFSSAFEAARYYSFTMLPKGAVIAVVELAEVVPTQVMIECGQVSDLERSLGNYADGRFAWRFRNIRRLREPYYVSGHQGFFEVSERVRDLL